MRIAIYILLPMLVATIFPPQVLTEEPYHVDDIQFFTGYEKPGIAPLDSRDFIKALVTIIYDIEQEYKRQWTKTPSLCGEVVVSFMIGGEGGVYDVYIKSSQLESQSLEQEIITKFGQLSFCNTPTEKVHVLVPLKFEGGTVAIAR